jgi:hypothetical protein
MRSSSCPAVYRRCNRKAMTAILDGRPGIGENPHAALTPFGAVSGTIGWTCRASSTGRSQFEEAAFDPYSNHPFRFLRVKAHKNV